MPDRYWVPTSAPWRMPWVDRKSTRLNSSHRCISYAVFCLKKDAEVERLLLTDLCDRQRRQQHPIGSATHIHAGPISLFFNNRGPTNLNPFPIRHALRI